MYYFYRRWYDPSIGRFISPDPRPCPLSECQKLNRYVYVTNQPTTLTDPNGEGTLMCQTPDGIVSACGILRDSSGNLPLGTRILGSGAQPTTSTSSPGTTSVPDPSSVITTPTGILRDNFGNLPKGTRITVVRTSTSSLIMGTTTVGAINQQIDEDRARLRTTPASGSGGLPPNVGPQSGWSGLFGPFGNAFLAVAHATDFLPPCWQVVAGVALLVGYYASIPLSGGATAVSGIAVAGVTLVGVSWVVEGLSRSQSTSSCWGF